MRVARLPSTYLATDRDVCWTGVDPAAHVGTAGKTSCLHACAHALDDAPKRARPQLPVLAVGALADPAAVQCCSTPSCSVHLFQACFAGTPRNSAHCTPIAPHPKLAGTYS